MLAEHPVELGEAVESAGEGQLRDGRLGAGQQGLDISDPGHLNVVGEGESRD